MNKRIFSGVQPSGNLHIGNYLGAIKNWVKLQDEHNSIFCVVDLHAITVPQNPEELKKKTIEVAKIYLAAGIDPKKSTIFIQSHIPKHTELTWILNTITKVAELERMTQFKDKSGKNTEGESMGLFDYPVLMASDILLYDTNLVPVGEDQLQHIEITRTLAKRFNQKFGDTFIIPKGYVTKESMRIMGLDDPVKKMSKSAASEYNYIGILDEPETIRKKIMKAVTDSGTEIKYEESKPALKNLINICSAFSDKSPKEIEKDYIGKNYSDFKKDLAEVIISGLKPIQEKYNSLSDEKVLEILKAGAEKVRPLAQKKLEDVKKKVGLIL
jgi:tryptophanyl-tRNA synthetase